MSNIGDDYIEVSIDVRKINAMFKDLNMSTDQARKALRKGLSDSARVIQRQARKNLSLVQNKESGKLLSSKNLRKWIRFVVYKRTLGFRVHIQQSRGSSKQENPSYLLKFFEEGTDHRYNKRLKKERMFSRRLKSKRYTGKITASHFFSNASREKIRESESKLQMYIEKHIKRIAAKK